MMGDNAGCLALSAATIGPRRCSPERHATSGTTPMAHVATTWNCGGGIAQCDACVRQC